MIRLSSLKMANQRRLGYSRRAKFHIFSTITTAAIFFTYIFTTETFTSNLSIYFVPKTINPLYPPLLSNQTFIIQQIKSTSYSIQKPIQVVKEFSQETVLGDDHNLIKNQRIHGLKDKLPELDILKSTTLTRRFEIRVQEFFKDECKIRFFMIWISSSSKVFGDREFLAVDALFKSNPNSCLIILSNTMDSIQGFQILKPIIDRGFRAKPITPDLDFLFNNTPAQSWFDHIKNGKKDPGEIPLAQNLSNLIRLAILYKYGGVYIDTDFITLKDFSNLRNSIGAQSASQSGNWTRLNNAVLVFDKDHQLLYKFMEEFAETFNGNKWGYNGPYLVSRVVERKAATGELHFTVLPEKAFYPVDWRHIGGLFKSPVNRRWVEAKVVQLSSSAYGIHLWNKQSRGLRIEEGSIMARLINQHCVICKLVNKTQILSENTFII